MAAPGAQPGGMPGGVHGGLAAGPSMGVTGLYPQTLQPRPGDLGPGYGVGPSAYSAAWRSPCGVPGSLSAFAIQRWTVMRRSCRKRFALSDVSG